MSKVEVKAYDINQQTLEIRFQLKVVSIDCTAYTSRKDLADIYQKSKVFIHQIKKDYYNFFKEDLKISNRSFIAEIWGHLVAYKISLWLKRIKFKPIYSLAKFAAKRSGTIDCGESKVDTNRWVWDILGWIFFRKHN